MTLNAYMSLSSRITVKGLMNWWINGVVEGNVTIAAGLDGLLITLIEYMVDWATWAALFSPDSFTIWLDTNYVKGIFFEKVLQVRCSLQAGSAGPESLGDFLLLLGFRIFFWPYQA